MTPVHAATAGTVLPVTSCADDGGPGTLRAVMMAAPQHAIIDLTSLACDTIVLTQGVIDITDAGYSATVQGPGADRLKIDGNQNGAIFHAFSLQVDGLTLTNGRVSGDQAIGGCVRAEGDVVLRSSRVTGCSAYGTQYASGGGIFAVYSVVLYSTTIANNTALVASGVATGGGISAHYNNVDVTDSTISGNTAGCTGGIVYGSGMGGGVYALGYSRVIRSTVDHNVADTAGGWVCRRSFFHPADCTVKDSTISGNIAHVGGGGLVVADPGARLVIDNSTVAFNEAQGWHVGGVLLTATTAADITLQSAIFSNNTAAVTDLAADIDTDVAESPTVTGGNDLLMTVGRIQPFPAVVGDPLLGPLADNGGPTWTHALLPGSPAIDAGNNVAALDTDQRGRNRVSGAATDIGAYEVQTDAIFANGFD